LRASADPRAVQFVVIVELLMLTLVTGVGEVPPKFFLFGWPVIRSCVLMGGSFSAATRLLVALFAATAVLAVWTKGFQSATIAVHYVLLATNVGAVLTLLLPLTLLVIVVANAAVWIVIGILFALFILALIAVGVLWLVSAID
jgi:hypothetical protein